MNNFVKNKASLKHLLLSIHNFFIFFGLDLKKIYYLIFIPKFIANFFSFKLNKGKVDKIKPILSNFEYSLNSKRGHYFHQDLIVANKIHIKKPIRHIDIGSRVDGFVAHVASYRKIEVFDLQNSNLKQYPNIKFNKIDITKENNVTIKTDSISCLHSIEHFGLGRYGDDIDPYGHIKGFKNLLKFLDKNGNLYISFPISTKTRVEFNEQRVFHYKEILQWLKNCGDNYILECFDFIDDSDEVHLNFDINKIVTKLNYGCGIYTIKKL